MKIEEVGKGLLNALDTASSGGITKIVKYCRENAYDGHVSVQTHFEGLDKESMVLFIQAFKGDETVFFTKANLTGSAQILGWNLYIAERVASARTGLASANVNIALAETG